MKKLSRSQKKTGGVDKIRPRSKLDPTEETLELFGLLALLQAEQEKNWGKRSNPRTLAA